MVSESALQMISFVVYLYFLFCFHADFLAIFFVGIKLFIGIISLFFKIIRFISFSI